ncbi:hypothetical protein SADUNF_Sadunf06G0219100 [Salix dunnii]|uniref:NB-ARC domain-containing protein n=1 Tax=Salix dunnii TaxID=1413687 RepID=A0A835K5W3_9ROSI|nr:hypothetical protein SADUNF_Sadunf06G0219100 [Salix dunnii]
MLRSRHKNRNRTIKSKTKLKKLGEAVYDADDLLDDFSTQVLRSNQFACGLLMSHRVKALREKLDDNDTDSKRFHLEGRNEERASLITLTEQTTFSEPKRRSKVLVKMGRGKTTLAQRVYNDEQVKVHFGVKQWLNVSGCLDARKILKGVVGRDDDQVWKMSLKRKLKKREYLLVLDDVWDGEDGPDGENWARLKEL